MTYIGDDLPSLPTAGGNVLLASIPHVVKLMNPTCGASEMIQHIGFVTTFSYYIACYSFVNEILSNQILIL